MMAHCGDLIQLRALCLGPALGACVLASKCTSDCAIMSYLICQTILTKTSYIAGKSKFGCTLQRAIATGCELSRALPTEVHP